MNINDFPVSVIFSCQNSVTGIWFQKKKNRGRGEIDMQFPGVNLKKCIFPRIPRGEAFLSGISWGKVRNLKLPGVFSKKFILVNPQLTPFPSPRFHFVFFWNSLLTAA